MFASTLLQYVCPRNMEQGTCMPHGTALLISLFMVRHSLGVRAVSEEAAKQGCLITQTSAVFCPTLHVNSDLVTTSVTCGGQVSVKEGDNRGGVHPILGAPAGVCQQDSRRSRSGPA